MIESKREFLKYTVEIYTSVAVFIFSALALTVSGGYSYGPILLLLGGVILILSSKKLNLSKLDILVILLLLLYFLIQLFSNIIHQLPLNYYDLPSRFLLAIPAYILLINFPPRKDFFL